MGAVVAELIPLMIAAAIVPAWIVIVLLMLTNKGGVARAAAFVLGTVLVRVVQALVFGYVFQQGAEGDGGGGSGAIKAVLLLLVGVVLLILAYKKWTKEEDPDAPPPKWMSNLATMPPLKALGFGILMMAIGFKHWVFTLSALASISAAQLGQGESLIAFLIYVLGAISLLVIPTLFAAIAPEPAAKTLNSARAWLERNNRPVTVIVSLVFGAYFLIQGVTGLLG